MSATYQPSFSSSVYQRSSSSSSSTYSPFLSSAESSLEDGSWQESYHSPTSLPASQSDVSSSDKSSSSDISPLIFLYPTVPLLLFSIGLAGAFA